ncbi:hypothetical protein [Novosphingobium mangrovi (ex Hu et al. 2023)]|uniref:DUF4148 domain-containing protein n=1 Tax=Novosphingobium mangrovi (ex Hu et al. 2023) TaxID=2930094 RepID=A0ABT0AA48_9SPHN|nr:hypothetical protein [Novosphingobium mangrovi (ex Hu et al. 2023)]MCJ1960069.1 hypothetical protein [Novosphingobium mangrovi (ex Hu et al. 2023)]
MIKTKTFRTAVLAAAVAIPAGAAVAAMPMSDMPMTAEQQWAQTEEGRIMTSPIAGIENSQWFDYQGNVLETKKELSSDLKRATDLEDARDAYGEYAHELKDNRLDYAEYMAEKGHTVPRVYLEN